MNTKYKLHDLVYLNDKNQKVIEAHVINTSPWGEYTLLLERGEIYRTFESRIYPTWAEAFKTLPGPYRARHYLIVAGCLSGSLLVLWYMTSH